MALYTLDLEKLEGGAINPTIFAYNTLKRGQQGTFTDLDLSKNYVFIGCYRYGDATYRSEVQTIINGTVTSLTNNHGSTYITLCTLSGTTLTYGSDSSANYYMDYTLIQLD